MSIYFPTNIPEMKSIFTFNWLSLEIAKSTRRLETGQRILTAADDPSGLIVRESMRADIKGLQAAQKNTTQANSLLDTADGAMASIVDIIRGQVDDDSGMSLLEIIQDQRIDPNDKKAMIGDLLSLINATAASTTYGGKQIINGDLAYTTAGVDRNTLVNMQVNRAASGGQTVEIVNTQAASQARLTLMTDETSGLQAGDTISVGLQNKTQKVYTLTADDIDVDGKIKASSVDVINAAISGSGVTASVAAGNIQFITDRYGADQTLFVTSDNAGLTGAVRNDDGRVAGDAVGREATFRVNGSDDVTARDMRLTFSSSDLGFVTGISEAFATTTGAVQRFTVTGGGATFQLGKDVVSGQQLRIGIPGVNTSNLGGASGVLSNLLDLDYNKTEDVARASAIVGEALDGITQTRARLGVVQKGVIANNSIALENQLLSVTESEALISNTDTALESSKLARYELLAQAAMNSILYSRSYAQYVAGSLY